MLASSNNSRAGFMASSSDARLFSRRRSTPPAADCAALAHKNYRLAACKTLANSAWVERLVGGASRICSLCAPALLRRAKAATLLRVRLIAFTRRVAPRKPKSTRRQRVGGEAIEPCRHAAARRKPRSTSPCRAASPRTVVDDLLEPMPPTQFLKPKDYHDRHGRGVALRHERSHRQGL